MNYKHHLRNYGSNALKGAQTGAQIGGILGTVLPGVGNVIGAAGGAVAGAGIANIASTYQAFTNPNGASYTPQKAMFAKYGAELEKQETVLRPDGNMLSFNGPSHEQGGIPYSPRYNSEFVFSDSIGFDSKNKLSLNPKITFAKLSKKFQGKDQVSQNTLNMLKQDNKSVLRMFQVPQFRYGGTPKKYYLGGPTDPPKWAANYGSYIDNQYIPKDLADLQNRIALTQTNVNDWHSAMTDPNRTLAERKEAETHWLADTKTLSRYQRRLNDYNAAQSAGSPNKVPMNVLQGQPIPGQGMNPYPIGTNEYTSWYQNTGRPFNIVDPTGNPVQQPKPQLAQTNPLGGLSYTPGVTNSNTNTVSPSAMSGNLNSLIPDTPVSQSDPRLGGMTYMPGVKTAQPGIQDRYFGIYKNPTQMNPVTPTPAPTPTPTPAPRTGPTQPTGVAPIKAPSFGPATPPVPTGLGASSIAGMMGAMGNLALPADPVRVGNMSTFSGYNLPALSNTPLNNLSGIPAGPSSTPGDAPNRLMEFLNGNYGQNASALLKIPGTAYNLIRGLSKPEENTLRLNNQMSNAINLMADRRYDPEAAYQAITRQTNAARAQSVGTNPFLNNARNQAITNSAQSAMAQANLAGQQMNNQYRAQEAATRAQLGSQERAYRRETDLSNLQAKAARNTFLAQSFSDMSAIGDAINKGKVTRAQISEGMAILAAKYPNVGVNWEVVIDKTRKGEDLTSEEILKVNMARQQYLNAQKNGS